MLLCQRRQWQPTPVLWPGKSHRRRSLVGCSTWGCKSQTRLSDFTFTFHFHALEKEMATHSSVLAWRIPGMGEPGGLPSMRSHRVGHDWRGLAAAAAAAWVYVLTLSYLILYKYTQRRTKICVSKFIFVISLVWVLVLLLFQIILFINFGCEHGLFSLQCAGFLLRWLLSLQSRGSRACALR